MVSWGNLADRLEQWATSKYALSNGYPVLPWYHGIKWWLLSGLKSLGEDGARGGLPRVVGKANSAVKLHDGNYLVADSSGHQIVEIKPDYSVEWTFGEFGVSGSDLSHLDHPRLGDYNPDLDRVLISDGSIVGDGNKRILEVDYDTKEVLNEITSYGGNSFDIPGAVYNPFTDDIIVADRNNHMVAEIERDGTVKWSFGVYGTSGADMTHLDNPWTAFPDEGDPDRVTIADTFNNRCLTYDHEADSVEEQYVLPQPDAYHQRGTFGALCSSEERSAYVTTSDGLMWLSPFFGWDFIRITREGDVLTGSGNALFEVDPRAAPPGTLPQSRRIYEDVALGGSWRPITGAGYSRVKVNAISTESDTLEIGLIPPAGGEVPFRVDSGSFWTDQIETYDTVSLTANELDSYILTAPDALICARMTGTGTGQMWVEQGG